MLKLFLLGVGFVVSVYLTYKIHKFGRDAYVRGVINSLEDDPELRQMVKNRFGWK
ncbi:hypothetical protein J7L81_05300 [Candidatus Aerophobetes bacterium]|nr:hypothetical protein [Candidatus Aerophobetes bacterium]